MHKILILSLIAISFLAAVSFTHAADIYKPVITPDSPFYFLKTWRDSIQTFFTIGAENKAKQYLHLSEIRLAEYNKMVEKGKEDIAKKTLEKYENQLNRAVVNAEELKQKGKDITDLTQSIEKTTSKHLEVLQRNLEKAPEQAREGIQNAITNSSKQIERIGIKPIISRKPFDGQCTAEAKICPDGTAVGRTGPNCEFAECPGANNKTEEQTGYIKAVYEKNKKRYLDIDYIQQFTGEDAIEEAMKDTGCGKEKIYECVASLNNGFYIKNQDSLIRTFEISPISQIKIQPIKGLINVSYEEFKKGFLPREATGHFLYEITPFIIEINNGVVQKIIEQYIP